MTPANDVPFTDLGHRMAWRKAPEAASLPEVHRTVSVPATASPWRKMLAFAGPGFLVAVGYMDPGNWATDLAGGAQFGYTLLSVIMISNLMAILLQRLCVQARHRHRPRPGAGLPRPLLAAGRVVALGAVRDRHRRLRSRRGRSAPRSRCNCCSASRCVCGVRHHRARRARSSCTCRTRAFATSKRW